MKAKNLTVLAAVLSITVHAFSAEKVSSKIVSRNITYTVDGQKLIGTISYDKSIKGKRPGILVVHEWQGINKYAKQRSRDLAKEGYIAFALDMYGDGKEIPRSEAKAMSGKIGTDFPLIKKRFNAALAILKKQKNVDAKNIGAIGYCFGGGIVLNMARMGTDIKGVVGFHSSINTGLTAKKGDIKTRILAIQGDGDPAAPVEKQQAFLKEMKENGADFSYIIFGNLPAHNFTNPESKTYHRNEAQMAWASMIVFFRSVFK